ncbi:NUDIX domain-containing protein [Dactylosporangium sp. NPDC051485]|uniref:NUDIX domain-containing protein n=1 Tax=Dactylosporangium sp. NPDC051485 TaxID=3154846 RepID=UPI00341361D3
MSGRRRRFGTAGRVVPYTVPVDLLLLYTHGPDLLVGLRQGGFAAGHWDTPSGKLEPDEPLEHGMAREALEETGLRLPPHLLQVVAMTHWYPPDATPRIGVYFHLEASPAVHGVPFIAEPAKCAELRWAPLDALPSPLLRYAAIGVELYRSRRPYAAMDWPEDPVPDLRMGVGGAG